LSILFGAAFVSILFNGMNILNISSYVQTIIGGALLVTALCIDALRKR
jgi:ribose transport system permease protein